MGCHGDERNRNSFINQGRGITGTSSQDKVDGNGEKTPRSVVKIFAGAKQSTT